MAISKVTTASIITDAVGPTQLNEAANYDFTGTVTGAGETNTPAFNIYLGSTQNVSDSTSTKVALDQVIIDTDSGFDATNDRWTVPSGKAGKYVVSFRVLGAGGGGGSGANSQTDNLPAVLKLNGTIIAGGNIDFRSNPVREARLGDTIVLDLSVGDYIEVWGTVVKAGSNTPYFGGGTSGGERNKSGISGYRITSS